MPGADNRHQNIIWATQNHSVKEVSAYIIWTGYTHGASRVNVTSFCSVLFCVHLQIDIHVSLNRDVGNTKGW